MQTNFALAARNIPHVDVLPVQGINVYDILRHEKLVLTKAAVEALEAGSNERACALRRDPGAGHHREIERRRPSHNQVVFKVRRDATKPEIKAAVEELFGVKVGREHAGPQGQGQGFRGIKGTPEGHQEGVVTLAEGHTIDVTTGI